MSNMLRAEVSVEGTRPLLWHHFGADAISADGKRKARTGVAGNDPEEWRNKVLVTKEGQLYLQPTYVFASIRDAARYTENRRSSLQPAMAATLQVTDEIILVDRYFPRLPQWARLQRQRGRCAADRRHPTTVSGRAVGEESGH
jgi:hypothetical protein